MKRILRDDRAKLALASALVQGTNFSLLLVAKSRISDDDFVFLLTQLATVGILGAIASLRMEVLMYQSHQRITRAALLIPAIATGLFTFFSYAGFFLSVSVWANSPFLSPLAAPMLLGLALSNVLNFAFVQIQRLNLLLSIRVVQCTLIALVMVLVAARWWVPSGDEILLAIGLAYALPSVFSFAMFFAQIPIDNANVLERVLPDWVMFRRSISLTFSTALNSIYVNLPVLAAAATQNAGFVADFGLIMRAFNAPITLVGQVIGRLFLASALRWSTEPGRVPSALTRIVTSTMVQSLGLYLVIAPMVMIALYLYREPLKLSDFNIVPFLFLAGLGQCVINPVSQVRMPLSDERAFLCFDFIRLLALGIGLYVVGRLIPFDVAFGVFSVLLYASYVPFIFHRVNSAGFAGG